MKTKIGYMLLALVALFYSCDQEIDYPYSGKDRVHFKHYVFDSWNNSFTYYTSQILSLGLLPVEVERDTVDIIVELLGKVSDKDRTYKIMVNADSTTAETGRHYETLEEMHTFRAGLTADTLKIIINRNELSTSFRNPEDEILFLEIVESDDFSLGLTAGTTTKLIINNYLSEPEWWEDSFFGALGFFHPKKWMILNTFTDDLATYGDIPSSINYNTRT